MGIESSYSGEPVDFAEAFGVDEVVVDHDYQNGVQIVNDGGHNGEIWPSDSTPDAMHSSGILPDYDD